ncbi:trans-aconitate 2-methyltransferase [Pseudochelatococcus sp. G4_1912]|uniref:trans-aconitate 2-methyltransferase n=1 Tax=Pseudochelatococcus sp. G4_1912 TaxID=3114288 RepID=UPI0039C6DEF5
MPQWDARQYLKFENERTRPARDLLAQVPLTAPRMVADLGCGPGNSTQLLVERFPKARVIGVDTAPDMLEKARIRLPHVQFLEGDVAAASQSSEDSWRDHGPFDLLYANAVLQWLPDHATLLPSLVELLTRGGVLAVQMPDNLDQPSHRLIREVAAAGPWSARLAGIERMKLACVTAYYDMLTPYMRRVDIWHTIYQHPLDDVNAIAEWGKGTGLLPYLGLLDASEQALFLADYTEKLAAHYHMRADGKVLLAFPRLFIVAQK